jgi:RsmE family RNA methyltransferase
LNLLILSEEDRVDDLRFAVGGKRRQHIVKVLRGVVGDSLEVGLIGQLKGQGVIKSIDKDSVILECCWTQGDQNETPAIDLILALPRPQTLKKVLQTVATMGVSNLHLINANRVEQCYFKASATEPDAIRYHLIKGLSQGKRTKLPEVKVYPRFRCFFEEILPRLEESEKGKTVKLVAEVGAADYLARRQMEGADKVLLAIGPEGGWVPFELEVMQTQGFKDFKLGGWPLRVEYAVVACLSQLKLAGEIGD